jgi:hypothetical protein
MTRSDAIAILSARMIGAPSYADYAAWLDRQSDWTLVALVDGQPVHVNPRKEVAS